MRFSHFKRLSADDRKSSLNSLYKKGDHIVEIYAFAFMPNHYHFLIKQIEDKGISNFLRIIQNGYAKYLNTKEKRSGSVFQQMFKVVRIEQDAQLLHVARYIHLNPLTSYVLKDEKDLEKYPWNSFADYLSANPRVFVNTKLLGKLHSSKNKFKAFTLSQLNYQRNLEKIKHLLFD